MVVMPIDNILFAGIYGACVLAILLMVLYLDKDPR